MSWDTGVALTVNNMAKIVQGISIRTKKYLDVGNVNVHDTLTSWSHIVIALNHSGTFHNFSYFCNAIDMKKSIPANDPGT